MLATPTPKLDANVMALCEAAKQDIIDYTEKMVNMDSGSDDFPELRAKQAELVRMLRELGGEVREIEAAAEARRGTYNIVATWRGTGKVRILYMNHYDTVWSKGEAAKRPFTIRDGVATGPGVSDSQCNFGGLRSMLDILLNKLKLRNFDRITVLFNCDEEKVSWGSKDLILEQAALHDVVYSLDGGALYGDEVTISARGGMKCELFITGVEAHSGANPEQGRNAGYEMAHQMMRMRDLSDKSRGTDVNWTLGNFGTKSNVIPGSAWAHANVRVSVPEECDRVSAAVRERVKDQLFPESKIRVECIPGRPPFTKNPITDALAEKAIAIYAETGRELKALPTGGGTDSNFSCQKAPTLEGLGLGGGGWHGLDESLPLDNIVPRLYLLVRIAIETMNGNMLPQSK